MKKKIFSKNIWIVLGLALIVALPSADAFARGHEDRGRHHEYVVVGHERLHYRDGRFYRPWWFGFEFVIAPPRGVIVTILPVGHRTVFVRGATYYYYDNIYYRSCPTGYEVVPAPVVVPSATYTPSAPGQTVTINVPNSNGSFTPITLVKQGNGYIGPQGEYYSGNPTVDQLKVLYGR